MTHEDPSHSREIVKIGWFVNQSLLRRHLAGSWLKYGGMLDLVLEDFDLVAVCFQYLTNMSLGGYVKTIKQYAQKSDDGKLGESQVNHWRDVSRSCGRLA